MEYFQSNKFSFVLLQDMNTKMSLQQHKEARPVSNDNQINIR